MMKVSQTMKKTVVYSAAILAPMLWSAESSAGTVALTLVRSTLQNVDDSAGRWQHEGGTIKKGLATVGQYAIHRRVTTGGTTVQNTAMTTATLFFSNTGTPPQNVTLQGAHNFTNGYFYGSVSAGSNRYNWVQGADVYIIPTQTLGTSTVAISWTGASQLTLP